MKRLLFGVFLIAAMLVLVGSASAKSVPKATGEVWFTEPMGSNHVHFAVFDYGDSGDWGYYSGEIDGVYYMLEVVKVMVSTDMAFFAGQITECSLAEWIGVWLFIGVKDAGEPAYMMDQVWGEVGTEAQVLGWVDSMHGGTMYPVEAGNLQVHTD